MSSRKFRRRQNSWGRTYRLNRAALMRMEEGRRKVTTKENANVTDRIICIELNHGSNIVDQNEESESAAVTSESEKNHTNTENKGVKNKARERTRKMRNKRRNSSMTSNRLRLQHWERLKTEFSQTKGVYQGTHKRNVKSAYSGKDWSGGPGGRRRERNSGGHYHQPTTSHYHQPTTSHYPIKRIHAKKRSQSSQVNNVPCELREHTPTSIDVSSNVGETKQKRYPEITKPFTSPSRHKNFSKRTEPKQLIDKSRLPTNISWGQPDVLPITAPKETMSSKDRDRTKILENSILGDTETTTRSVILNDRRANRHQTEDIKVKKGKTAESILIFKHYGDQSSARDEKKFLINTPPTIAQEMSRGIHLNENLKAPTVESHVAVSDKAPTLKPRGEQLPRTRSPAGQQSLRSGIFHKRLRTPVSMSPDQKEVISKWRKRLGTSSPTSSAKLNASSSILVSSSLRDSQILRVHNVPTEEAGNTSSNKAIILSDLTPQKDSAVRSLEEIELQNLISSFNRQTEPINNVSPQEEELFVKLERERIKKRIHRLEDIAREKIQQLEIIRRKKKKAAEDHIILNEKLERILSKIYELKGSNSFAILMDKQTQVFATKRPKTILP